MIDYLVLGQEGQSSPVFDVKNKRLKELCKRVDHLKKDDQEVICHFLDMAVKQNQLKQVMGTAS